MSLPPPRSDVRADVERLVNDAYEQSRATALLSRYRAALAGTLLSMALATAVAEVFLQLLGDARLWSTLLLAGDVFLVGAGVSFRLGVWWYRRTLPSRREFQQQVFPTYLGEHAYAPGWSWAQYLADPWGVVGSHAYDTAMSRCRKLAGRGYPGLARFDVDWRVVPGVVLAVSLLIAARLAISDNRLILGWFLTFLMTLFLLLLRQIPRAAWTASPKGPLPSEPLEAEAEVSAADRKDPAPSVPLPTLHPEPVLETLAPPEAPPPPKPVFKPRPDPAKAARQLTSLFWIPVLLVLFLLLLWQIGSIPTGNGETVWMRLVRQFGGEPGR